MNLNLLKNTKNLISKSLLNKTSSFLDELNEDVKEAVDLVIPLIFSSFIHFNNTKSELFIELLKEYDVKSINSDDIRSIFSGDNSLLLDKNYHFLSNFFNTEAMTNAKYIVADSTYIDQESVTTLLKILITPVLISINTALENNKLSKEEVIELLKSQKEFIDKKVTADIMSKIINNVGFYTLKLSTSKKKETSSVKTFNKNKFGKIGIGFLILMNYITVFYNKYFSKKRSDKM